MLWIFFARKIRRLRPRSNPRSWVPEASMLTTRPPKPLRRLKQEIDWFGLTGRRIKSCMIIPDLTPVRTQRRQLKQWSATVLHLPCSPDLAPSNFNLSGNLKDAYRRHRFADNDEPKHSMFEELWHFNKFTWPAYDVWRDIGKSREHGSLPPKVTPDVNKHISWSQRPLLELNKPLPYQVIS